MDWCQRHEFWSSVVLSPEKFRKHYSTMEAQRARDGRKPDVKVEEVERTKAFKAQSQEWEQEIVRRQSVSTPMPKGFKNVLKGRE